MERLLQKIVLKFIKHVDFNKVKLVKAWEDSAEKIDPTASNGDVFICYKIKYNFLTIGAILVVINKNNGKKYLSSININPAFRSI